MNNLPSHTYYLSEEKAGPTVVIMGAVHGNERIGVKIIESLKKLLPKEGIFGKIYLIIGNPKAYQENVRFVDCDLNRLFDDDFEKLAKKQKKLLAIEERRALELARILAKADYLIDIHSTIKKSTPFVYVKNSSAHLALAKVFGTQYVVSFMPSCKLKSLHFSADNFVDKHGGIGITYETGWHQDDSTFADVLHNTKKFLKYIGSAFTNLPSVVEGKEARHIFIYREIAPQKKEFNLARDYRNFDFLKKGESLGIDGDTTIVVEQDSYVVFPKKDVSVGKTACYLASENFNL